MAMKAAHALRYALVALLVAPGLALCEPGAGDAAPDDPPVWVNPGFFSYHFNRDAGLRGDNWGLGAQVDLNADASALAGTYINSNYVRSHYAALVWQPLAWDMVKIGVLAGVVNGYSDPINDHWLPAVLPWVTIRGGPVGVNLSYAPNYPHGMHRAVIAQLMLRVW